MTTLLIAIIVLLILGLVLLGFILWVCSNIRDDQLVIRTFIAKELRAKRADQGAPTDDDGFYKWLQAHPDRPHRDDPPASASSPGHGK